MRWSFNRNVELGTGHGHCAYVELPEPILSNQSPEVIRFGRASRVYFCMRTKKNRRSLFLYNRALTRSHQRHVHVVAYTVTNPAGEPFSSLFVTGWGPSLVLIELTEKVAKRRKRDKISASPLALFSRTFGRRCEDDLGLVRG